MSYHARFHEKITTHDETETIQPVIDAHLHFVDFIQDTDGIRRLLKAYNGHCTGGLFIIDAPVDHRPEGVQG